MAEALSLAVGDRVVYPNQGLCKVTGVETKEIGGQRLSFVTLQREEDGAKVMVPEAKVVAIGVRKVSDLDEVARVFAFLKSDSDKASLDWKARARTNVERMSTGGLMGLIEVVKGLQVLSELRPLPTKERELYNDARHLLVTELAASLKCSECDAEDTVDVVLFPPGKERPKRLAEEFRVAAEGDEDLGLEGDLLGIDGETVEEPAEAAEAGEEAEEEAGEEGDGEEKPKKKVVLTAKPGKKPSMLSDLEVTAPAAAPFSELPAPRKR
ncbi:MAG: transcriptional regulator, partial [Myxococcaceae bacterium]|nr:transcriptional regulator [Myxococcaceae bacterium]